MSLCPADVHICRESLFALAPRRLRVGLCHSLSGFSGLGDFVAIGSVGTPTYKTTLLVAHSLLWVSQIGTDRGHRPVAHRGAVGFEPDCPYENYSAAVP